MTRRGSAAAQAFAAAVLDAGLALAQGGTARGAAGEGGTAAAGGESTVIVRGVQYVSDYFTHELANGCHYRSALVGLLHTERSDGPLRFSGKLNVGAEVVCPDGARASVRRNVLRVARLTASQLEKAIARRARLVLPTQGQVCVFAPRFHIAPGVLRAESVTYSCEPARGGGPLGLGCPW